jgi:hypothetical protein
VAHPRQFCSNPHGRSRPWQFEEAEKALAKYIVGKPLDLPKDASHGDVAVDLILEAYVRGKDRQVAGWDVLCVQVERLAAFWHGKSVADIVARTCRGY